MKIGFISRCFPLPLERCVHGIYKRMGLFIEAMKETCELEMLFYVDPALNLTSECVDSIKKLLSKHWNIKINLTLCRRAPLINAQDLWGHFIRPALSALQISPFSLTSGRDQVEACRDLLSKDLDCLFIHRLDCMTPLLLIQKIRPKIYLDLDDIEHIAMFRNISLPPWWRFKWLYYLRIPVLALWERRAIRYSNKTFVCSEKDKNYLSRFWNLKNVVVIPNTIAIPQNQIIPENQTVMFIGNFKYPPNAIAADFMIKKIWPRILSVLHKARLWIVGECPENISSFQEGPQGVTFLGFVENLDALYRDVKVVSCPILSGGGTRIKILEAAAYGKPVVSTRIGAEGLELKDGQDIVLHDDPEFFAASCIELLENSELSRKIGSAGRSTVIQKYDKRVVINQIRKELDLIPVS